MAVLQFVRGRISVAVLVRISMAASAASALNGRCMCEAAVIHWRAHSLLFARVALSLPAHSASNCTHPAAFGLHLTAVSRRDRLAAALHAIAPAASPQSALGQQ